jgi:hypothetical protein
MGMSRSFLARFRGEDARSIAHALAILLVFNAILGAFHSGSMANAATGEIVLCSSDGALRLADGLPKEPGGREGMSCCVLGCGPSPAIAAEPAALAASTYAVTAFALPLFETGFTGPKRPGSASPRGPPILS